MHPTTRALMTAVPYPDPDRPLDFNAIGAGRQSNPGAWPEPFCCGAGGDPPMQRGIGRPFRAGIALPRRSRQPARPPSRRRSPSRLRRVCLSRR